MQEDDYQAGQCDNQSDQDITDDVVDVTNGRIKALRDLLCLDAGCGYELPYLVAYPLFLEIIQGLAESKQCSPAIREDLKNLLILAS